MTLDLAIREAMVKCLAAEGAPVNVTYTLGDIPWKITVEVDAEKIKPTTQGEV